jgi:hypothetical protein
MDLDATASANIRSSVGRAGIDLVSFLIFEDSPGPWLLPASL